MERLLAGANHVAENADKPDILDDIVAAMLRTVHIGMRVKTSYFPTVWNNATADAIKIVQEMMFVKIKHCINAKVQYCENLPWHGIHLAVADVVKAFLIIIQTRGSLVWGDACKSFEANWLSQADGQWHKYVHTAYKGVQVTEEQCKAFMQNLWEALPGSMTERVTRSRKRVGDTEAKLKEQTAQIDAMKGLMKAQEQRMAEFARNQGQVSRSSSSSSGNSSASDSEGRAAKAPKVAPKAAAPKVAPKVAPPKAAPKKIVMPPVRPKT